MKLCLFILLASLIGIALCTCCGCVSDVGSPQAPVRVTTTQPVDIVQELSAIKAAVTANTQVVSTIQAKVTGIETHTANSNTCDYWDLRLRTIFVAAFGLVAIWYASQNVPKWAQRLIANAR